MTEIWLFNPSGPLPDEGWRTYRYAMIGEVLVQHGYEVIWWTSTFSHHFKKFRSETWKDIEHIPGFTIRLVPTPGYKRHIGFARLRFFLVFALKVYQRTRAENMNADCVIAASPLPCVEVFIVRAAKRAGAVLVTDVMDLWPELFTLVMPKPLRRFAGLIFYPLRLSRRFQLNRSAGVTGLAADYVDLAVRESPHLRHTKPVTVFNGIDVGTFRDLLTQAQEVSNHLAEQYAKKPGDIWAIYAGTLGENYDILTILHAARLLLDEPRLKIIIAGRGPLQEQVIELIQTETLTNVLYVGSLALTELAAFYNLADIGLSCYGAESTVAMPDKAYDYMAAGMVTINSLKGELEVLLQREQIGLQYQAGQPETLADAIRSVIDDELKRDSMAQRAYAYAMTFDRDVQYAQFPEIVKNALQIQDQAPR